MPTALHARVEADPQLKAELQRRLENSSSTHALEDAFNKKDKDGHPVSTTDAVTAFINQPSFYAQALGVKPNFQDALKNAPKDIQDKVKAGYDSITSGADVQQLIASGKPADKAIIESGVSKAIYDTMFDEQTVKEGTDKFNESATKLARDDLLNGMSPDDLFKGLGVKGADDPALEQLVEKNMDSLFPSTKDRPKAADIVSAIRSINDAMRQGMSFDSAVDKVSKGIGNNLPKAVQDTFKTGVMHGASGILLAGALGAKSATGNLGSNTETAAQSIQAAALLVQGGAKFVGDQMNRFNAQAPNPNDSASLRWNKPALDVLKDIENVGKSVAVVGNVLGLVAGSMAASQSAAKGDTVGAGFQGTFAALNGVSAIAGAAEVGFYVAGRLAGAAGDLVAQAGAAIFEGIAGTVGAVVGGIAAIGGLIYAIVASVKADEEKARVINEWYDGVKNDFAQFGITPPDLGTTLAKPNAYTEPGSENLPAANY